MRLKSVVVFFVVFVVVGVAWELIAGAALSMDFLGATVAKAVVTTALFAVFLRVTEK